MTPGELGYTKISLGNIAAAKFFLTLDSLWAIGSDTMAKLNLESGASWTIPKAYRDSEVAIYENYFIEVGWRRASSITVLHPKTGQTMESEDGMESVVYDAQTGRKIARIPKLLRSHIIGVENHTMIVQGRERGLDETAFMEMFNLRAKPVSSRLVCLPAVTAVYKSFYQNGVLFYLGTTSLFSSQRWFYLDLANFSLSHKT